MAYSVPPPFPEAIRGSLQIRYTADATLDGAPIAGAIDLKPTGGSVTDTTKPGVRRKLGVEVAGGSQLYDLLSPAGTLLAVTCHVTYTNRLGADIPMGVFVVDDEKLTEGEGSISITAPDKWTLIQQARFIRPQPSTKNSLVVNQIASLIRGALGASEPVNITATSTATVGALTWEKDRDQAILKLAKDIGAWVYFDRNGIATIADIPTIGATADWLIDAPVAGGVLTELDRQRSRSTTKNVVVIESSHANGAKFATQVVWDDDPGSPTYAGTNPLTDPGSAGPFGIAVEYFDTPILTSAAQGRAAGRTILARSTGLASQVSLGQVPNPAVDAFDVLDVLPPREQRGVERVMERHVADTVTHPLTLGPAQQIEGRSTRIEELA